MPQQRRRPAPHRRTERIAQPSEQPRARAAAQPHAQIEQQHRGERGQQRRPHRHRQPHAQPQIAVEVIAPDRVVIMARPVAGDTIGDPHRGQCHQRHARWLVQIGAPAEHRLVNRQRGIGIDRGIAALDQPDRRIHPRRLIVVALPRSEPDTAQPDEREQNDADAAHTLSRTASARATGRTGR